MIVSQIATGQYARLLAPTSSPVPSRRRPCAPSPCFSTTSRVAKSTLQRIHEAFQLFLGIFRDSKGREQEGKRLKPDAEKLSEEQQTVLDLITQGRSVFFTGPAGTGKSVLLKKIIQQLAIKYLGDDKRVGITASTGLAAHGIGGTTLHRFAGVGLAQAPIERLIDDILSTKFKLDRWTDVEVLVIDEISMVDCLLFDKLDAIARTVRKIDRPFGGIQLVVTGDFFQLPPVKRGRDDGSPRFCFEAKAWSQVIQHTIGLTRVYRQRDPEFVKMLNEVREGCLSPSTIKKFQKLNRPVSFNGSKATELFPLRAEADGANKRRLQNIKGMTYNYTAKDGGTVTNAASRKMLLSNCIAPDLLKLKKGAQVILTRNIDGTLVNGSQGRVIGFAHSHSFHHTQWDDEDGEPHSDREPPVIDESSDQGLYPVVRFTFKEGHSRVQLCKPMEWTVERWVPAPLLDDGWTVEKLATRTQVPLLLAWALSIHKSQGQTLSHVKVDLARVFETGHAYVALSRAKSTQGLQVLNFDPSKVAVHPKVKAFYASLSKESGSGAGSDT
ncbi:ATP-dependent DNA helicase PIF1 [Neonectria ditissima]|uniref:ATP-dependent DNA helicase PIF1 n=1 Tax=Neonectria ditissima TaxID=78410 RepID=A0A0P7BLB4_9HYPO|nr:ATP-dependent DNA helicase PIF1 [Neonectria ditissima]